MKILLVTPFLPYPGVGHAGGKLCHYLLKILAARHELHLVARSFPHEHTHLERLRESVAHVHVVEGPGVYTGRSIWSLTQVIASYRRLAVMARKVLDSERFDIAQVEFVEAGVFWRPCPDVPSVLTFHDVIAKPAYRRFEAATGVRRIAGLGKYQLTRHVERMSASKFQRHFTLSEDDGRWANDLYPGIRPRVLKYPGGIEFAGKCRSPCPNRVLFVGALNRQPNLDGLHWFLDGCWPAILRQVPCARFQIVGQGLPEKYRRQWSADPSIEVVGPVADIESHYTNAAVFVAPILTGGGVIVKILDSLAAGTPVVTTSRGNEGIVAQHGVSLMIADSDEQFAMSVVRLLHDHALRDSVGRAGKRLVESEFSQQAFATTLEETYAEMLGERRRSEQVAGSMR